MSGTERVVLSSRDLSEGKSAEDCVEESVPPVIAAFRNKDGPGNGGGAIKCPVVVLVVGMAGSGKTTLMAQLYRSLSSAPSDDCDNVVGSTNTEPGTEVDRNDGDKACSENEDGDIDEHSGKEQHDQKKKVGYFMNLDPATKSLPFEASIDIRDTVLYKEVMTQHNLGPNGAIMTSLNLFATKFDQVLQILERRAYGNMKSAVSGSVVVRNGVRSQESSSAKYSRNQETQRRLGMDYIVVDTPGQIEAFTWSASGTIMSEGFASSFPTILAYVVDTPRCAASPNTFMSNMLYACSMLYRTRLPLLLVFNKTDVVPHGFATEWMTDYESFQEALDEHSQESGYYGSLTRSLSLVLDEFYSTLHHVGVSAATGDGVDNFWSMVDVAAKDFVNEYLPDLENRIEEQKALKRAIAKNSMRRLERDLAKSSLEGSDER